MELKLTFYVGLAVAQLGLLLFLVSPWVLPRCATTEEEDAGDKDAGFNLFFQSNREEMLDHPIHFDPPLPTWLSGTLVRNGLGLFENGDRSFLHAFDGFAKLSSWRFHSNGSAFFSTRFLGSSFYNDSMAGDTISPYLLFQGTTPAFGLLEKLQALFHGLDNMNVNVYRLPAAGGGDDYVALSDYWKVYPISPRDLSTGPAMVSSLSGPETSTLGMSAFLDLLSSAHPLPEVGTGHHLTFLSSVAAFPWMKNRVQLVRIKSTLEREVVASWAVDRVPYMHSFSVTETHALVLAHPFYVNVMCMAAKVTPFDCLQWQEGENSTLYVVHLQTGDVQVLSMDSVFTMHHVNAYNLPVDHHHHHHHHHHHGYDNSRSRRSSSSYTNNNSNSSSNRINSSITNNSINNNNYSNNNNRNNNNTMRYNTNNSINDNIYNTNTTTTTTNTNTNTNNTNTNKNTNNVRIIMDISSYRDPSFVGDLQLSVLRDPERRDSFQAHAELQRYEVDLTAGGVVRRVSMGPPPVPRFADYLDMPTINEEHRSRRYCFVYGLVLKTDNVTLGKVAIVKRDVCGLGRDRAWHLPNHYPVEPLFVPRPNTAVGGVVNAEEDDGVVLVPMIDGPGRRSYLAVLDAKDLSVLSSAYLPTLVPYSLHGRFFSEVL